MLLQLASTTPSQQTALLQQHGKQHCYGNTASSGLGSRLCSEIFPQLNNVPFRKDINYLKLWLYRIHGSLQGTGELCIG